MILNFFAIPLLQLLLCFHYSQESFALIRSASFQKQRQFKLYSGTGNQINKDGKKSNSGAKLLQKAVKRSGAATTKTGKTVANPETSRVPVKKVKAVPAEITSNSSISVSSSSKSVASVISMDDAPDGNGNQESLTVDDGFRTLLREFRKANAPKKLIRAVADYSQSGKLDQNMTVHAFRTLQRMNRYEARSIRMKHIFDDTSNLPVFHATLSYQRNDLCADLIPYWHIAVDNLDNGGIEIEPTVSLIRSCCKLQR